MTDYGDNGARPARRFWRRLGFQLLKLDLARARLFHDQPSIVDNLLDLGRFFAQDGEFDAAEKSYAEARKRATEKRYEAGNARAGIGLAATAFSRKDFPHAIDLYEAEVPALRLLPDRSLLVFALVCLGEANAQADRPERAEIVFRETEQMARQMGKWKELARSLFRLGESAFLKEDYQDAYARWTEALAIYRRRRQRVECAVLEHYLSAAAGRLGRLDEGRDLAARSVADYERAGSTEAAQKARIYLMDVDEYIVEQGRPEMDDE